MASINVQLQELSIANLRTQLLRKAGRAETWLWITPTINQMLHKNQYRYYYRKTSNECEK